jgi:translation initiation factor 2B subunit (eIF-2B alpha/beta/delta family)
VDPAVRHELAALSRDRISGAAELAARAAGAVLEWLRSHQRQTSDELVEMAFAVRNCQPQMASLFRLANELALAAEQASARRNAIRRLRRFRQTMQTAKSRIARNFKRALTGGEHLLASYSYSSTVAAALRAARKTILGVYCSESRPMREGRRLAIELNKAGVHTVFCSDAVLLSGCGLWAHLVLGADAVMPNFLVNKVGSSLLCDDAQRRKVRTWILADTWKYVPSNHFALAATSESVANDRSLWQGAPDGVLCLPTGFEAFPIRSRMRFVTEHGVWSLAEMRRFLRTIPLSTQIGFVAN